MKVQFLLSWCLERGVSELSPLARSIHLEHGKYILTIIQESNLIVIYVLVSHMYVTCILYLHYHVIMK